MKQSLRFKFLAFVAVITIFFSSFAVFQIQQRIVSNNVTEKSLYNTTHSLAYLQQLTRVFKGIRVDLRDFLLDPANRAEYHSKVVEAIPELNSIVAKIEQFASSPEVRTQIDDLKRNLPIFYDVGGRILTAGAARDIRGATNILVTECHPIGDAILQNIGNLERVYYAENDDALLQLQTSAQNSLLLQLVMVGLGLLLFLVLVAYVIRAVITPLLHINIELSSISKGDLTSKYQPLSRQDEIGDLSRALQETIVNLRTLISGAQGASFALAEKSVLMSGSIKEVAAGNDSQASIAQEISRTLEQLAASTEEIAANAQSAAAAGAKAKAAASEGTLRVGNSINSLQTVQESVLALSTVSKQIGGILSTIDDISDQTNLLALNAAIEAARAGEHGRGFAVVADAVRSLAEQSRQSTKEISKLIASIQGQIDKAVAISTQGAEGARTAREALENIVTQISNITAMIEGISAAGEEQAAAAGEVAASMENLGAITEEVAASSQESGVAGQQLSELAKGLQAAAAQFRV